MAERDWVQNHIDHCTSAYGDLIDVENFKRKVDRDVYEQMRADLLLAIGMLAALSKARGDQQ